MDIRILGLLNDIAAQNSINSYTGVGSSLSFPQVFSDVTGINQISAMDLFSAMFPTNSINVKVGNCNVTDKTWQRMDFPSWRYFQDNVSADSLNSWRAAGAEPTGIEAYIQRELKKVGFGEMAVIIPDSLQKKMGADSEYAREITEKLKKWKTDYDDMDNVLAASYGEDPVLHQKTKSYCVRLDEEGNVKNYMVISGGMDTEQSDKSDDTSKIYHKTPQKTVVRAANQRNVQRRYGNR
ncbi:MAG: hypothetical protein K2N00_13515 [Lachnospiraceae bacterium]|nr:hypothetical protein [Lachnospiraceae bacterium]